MFSFDRDNLPSKPQHWKEYRKVGTTRMIRITEPFRVETREGVIECQDGYLAVDSGGWPYPIAADEQSRIYVPAND